MGRILDFDDAEDAKADMKSRLALLTEVQRDNANRLIGRLHTRVHTTLVGNYYEETSQEYDKVLQEFVRANSAGQPLEYSDLLLATATAKWKDKDARLEIHDFTDSLNKIGTGYDFGKDFVLKACLYLTENLPIQYRVKNFTRSNLLRIEAHWDRIEESLTTTLRLVSRFGFNAKNIVAPLALLPIAFFLMRRGDDSFDKSSDTSDAAVQIEIRRWLIFAILKNAFGGSSDTTLSRIRDILIPHDCRSSFPSASLYQSLGIEAALTDAEIERVLASAYQGRYTYLVLSLLYPDRDWKDATFHEDHIFPHSEFQVGKLRKRGYDDSRIRRYMDAYNTICNLQLLTDTDNLSKNATPFDLWLPSQDAAFRRRHLIPEMSDYGFDHFEAFINARRKMIVENLSQLGPSHVSVVARTLTNTSVPTDTPVAPKKVVEPTEDQPSTIFREVATEVFGKEGQCEILYSNRREVWFLPVSWARIVPENGTAWTHLDRPVSVCCWLRQGKSQIGLIFEVSRMDDARLRLECVSSLHTAGFNFTANAFNVDAKYSRFFRANQQFTDMNNKEAVRTALTRLYAEAQEHFSKAKAALGKAFPSEQKRV